MGVIDKIIFNRLLSKESVALPNIGVLVPHFVTSVRKGQKLSAPHWVVTLKTEMDNTPSVIELLMHELNRNQEDATLVYFRWMTEANVAKYVRIERVGVIDQEQFEIDEMLDSVLNPLGYNVLVLPRQKSYWVKLSIAPLVAVLLLGGYFGWEYYDANRVEVVPMVKLVEAIKVAEPTVVAEQVIAESLSESTVISGGTSVGTQVDSISSKPVISVVEKSPYYLVVGVFSSDKNADKYIANTKNEEIRSAMEKSPFKGGKILVSIYNSQDKMAVKLKYKLYKSEFPSAWIYPVK